ncbi:hypothetical protein [Agarivorans litoreus]|nr:hypothetical protein [Agarivorans litoreus]
MTNYFMFSTQLKQAVIASMVCIGSFNLISCANTAEGAGTVHWLAQLAA